MEITSFSNPKVKHVVRLRNRRDRDEAGEMIVEGYRECRRALDAGYRPKALFHCPEMYLKNEHEGAIVEECAALGADVYACPAPIFAKIAYKERPDGLLMTGPHVSRRLEDLKLPANALVIVAEAIETGTMFTVPIAEASSDEALAWLKARGFRILAATPHAEKLHFEEDLSGNVAIALGAEQYGLTAKWMDGADIRVRIPMLGVADSLNVSAAAVILAYEAVRQRIASGAAAVPAAEPWHGEGKIDH